MTTVLQTVTHRADGTAAVTNTGHIVAEAVVAARMSAIVMVRAEVVIMVVMVVGMAAIAVIR